MAVDGSPDAVSTACRALTMPEVTSAVVGDLVLAITWSDASKMTASVLVPPTSMPRRKPLVARSLRVSSGAITLCFYIILSVDFWSVQAWLHREKAGARLPHSQV